MKMGREIRGLRKKRKKGKREGEKKDAAGYERGNW